jgi:hypothetical protein
MDQTTHLSALTFDSWLAQVGQEFRDGYGVELNDVDIGEADLIELHDAGNDPQEVARRYAEKYDMAPLDHRSRRRLAA